MIKTKKILLAAAFVVPLSNNEDWLQLKFDKIPINQVSHTASSLKIKVASSASPLIYKFSKPVNVKGFSFDLNINGEMKPKSTDEFAEDSYFRFGLVAMGKKKLSTVEKVFAVDWIKTLFSLSPPNVGLDKIYFYNLSHNEKLIGQSRTHPKSELMHETVFAAWLQKRTDFKIELPKALPILALWLSIDGDDTKSTFDIEIHKIQLDLQ